MARDWNIWGPTLVKVKGGAHLSGGIGQVTELGLSQDKIEIIPSFKFRPINPDDFGPEVPAELMWSLAYVDLHMNLFHYDDDVLDTITAESMAGGLFIPSPFTNTATAGQLPPAGMMMGRNQPVYSSGCHYIAVSLLPPISGQIAGFNAFPNRGFRFKSCYLLTEPFVQRIGVEADAVDCIFRCIPYKSYFASGFVLNFQGTTLVSGANLGEISSSGAVLWDRNVDTN